MARRLGASLAGGRHCFVDGCRAERKLCLVAADTARHLSAEMRTYSVFDWQHTGTRLMLIVTLLCLMSIPLSHVEAGSPRVLRITTVLLEPYMMIAPSSTNTTRGVQYVGFVADIVRKLSEVVGFRYELYVAPDNNYGYRKSDGTWNGMVKELLSKKAHMAAGPLLDTSQRREVIDFTMPFLNVHATILIRKPEAGGGHVGIRSVRDLVNQSAIRYGTLDKGIIPRAFKRTNDTILKEIWRSMNRFRPSTMTSTNEEGIRRVRRENYAFVIQDTIADYIAMKDPCDLTTVDKFLFTKSYALALPKNSRWLDVINKGMRMLKHGDTLRTLYRKWWLDKSPCDTEKPSSRSFSLAATSSAIGNHFSHVTTLCVCLSFSVLHWDWTASSVSWRDM